MLNDVSATLKLVTVTLSEREQRIELVDITIPLISRLGGVLGPQLLRCLANRRRRRCYVNTNAAFWPLDLLQTHNQGTCKLSLRPP